MTQRIALADAGRLLIAIIEQTPNEALLGSPSTDPLDTLHELTEWIRILGHPLTNDPARLRASILAALRTRPDTIGPIWRFVVGYGNVDGDQMIVWLADLDIHLPRICAALARND